MKCIACGKESGKNICHQCAILKSKKGFTDEELIYYMNLRELHVSSFSEVKGNRFLRKDTPVTFNCIRCGKEYTAHARNLLKKGRLLCHQCMDREYYESRYGKGVTNSFQLESTKRKIRESVREKYGVDCYLQTLDARDARRKCNTEYFRKLTHSRLDAYCSSIMFTDEEKRRIPDEDGIRHYQTIRCTCSRCGKQYETTAKRFQRCPGCFPEDWDNGTSRLEKEIGDYVESISPYRVERNVRGIIGMKELDIYIPELKVAVEVDGDWWHGYHDIDTDFRGIQVHSGDKQKLCMQKGIRLLTVKECDYRCRGDAIRRFLADTIRPKQRIYARDCTFREISTGEARGFCEEFHVNGFRGGEYKCGLFYRNELVCAAVFARNRTYGYECSRLCFRTGISITGGWERIRAHFGKPFIHYVDLMYFPGENRTDIGYRFVRDGKILSRNTMEKTTQLYRYCKKIDPKLQDFQNAVLNGFTVVFDCGKDIRFYNGAEKKQSPGRYSGAPAASVS